MSDHRVVLVMGALAIAAFVAGCPGDETTPACEGGLVRECACPGGSASVQSCPQSGTAWGECQCESCDPGLVRDCACPDGTRSTQRCDAAGSGWLECGCSGDDDDGDSGGTFPADLCDACTTSAECGGPADLCVILETGERFCGADCSGDHACPTAYSCYAISGGTSTSYQCVPDSLTCGHAPPPSCAPACAGDQVCRDGVCVAAAPTASDLQLCVDEINRHRTANGRRALARSDALDDCAGDGAVEDAGTGIAHGHFSRTSGCGWVADAENVIPGWPLSMYGSIREIIEGGTQMMMDEGPGGGHYENILGDHTSVGCGIYITDSGDVWVVQDFR
jgi:hypothetical protein